MFAKVFAALPAHNILQQFSPSDLNVALESVGWDAHAEIKANQEPVQITKRTNQERTGVKVPPYH